MSKLKFTTIDDNNQSQEWATRFTVWHVEQVLEATGIDLGLTGTEWYTQLLLAPKKVVEVLWVLVGPRATKLGITPEQFGQFFDGPTLSAAVDALEVAVMDLFLCGKARTILPKLEEARMAKASEQNPSTASTSPTNVPPSSTTAPTSTGQ